MENKIAWNLRVYSSVAKAFDDLVAAAHRGEKGTSVSAACLLFLMVPPEMRQAFIDAIKLAEGRGMDGDLFEAARQAWFKENMHADEQDATDVFFRIIAEARETRHRQRNRLVRLPAEGEEKKARLEAQTAAELQVRHGTSRARKAAS